jgi:hypothetical protein
MRARVASDDSGAALILVLIIVTVLSVGLSAVLSLTDTSIRATVATRAQASEAYAADAAAKIAVDQIRRGTFPGGDCDNPHTETLKDFYPATSTTPSASAAVRCTPDPDNGSGGGGGANSSPGSALLTLGTGTGGEVGLIVDSNSTRTVKLNGGIFVNSTIVLSNVESDLENTAANSYVYAMGNCTLNHAQIISTPAAVCDYAAQPGSANDRRGKDPGTIAGHGASFNPPPAPTVLQTPPQCTGEQVYELHPGLYLEAWRLNLLTENPLCANSVFHLNPGRYYFNFQDTDRRQWTIAYGHLVGGTATSTLDTTAPPAMPGSCVAPGASGSSRSSGVELVFGGGSMMDYTNDGNVELCASNSQSGPPIAIYGLKQGIGSGQFAVPAQSGCVTATPYPVRYPIGGDPDHCALLQSYNGDYRVKLIIQGTVYAPRSMIDVAVNSNTDEVFRWGLVSRGLRLNTTGDSNLRNPVIDVPADAPAPGSPPKLVYLEVFVCPGGGSCSTSGPIRLRTKVMVAGDAPSAVTVLSWSRPG